jgi:SAM-dependent methyltransferase
MTKIGQSTKTQTYRSQNFIDSYFKGKVIDIGGGGDPLNKKVEVFDLKNGDGDAQFILKYRKAESYDCVNSSHCLEHMKDVPAALDQWWSLVKPGGYMIIVVPHEDLYEQKIWPSAFNRDHKATFRLKTNDTWSPVSYDIFRLIANLPDSEVIDSEVQDLNYDYNLLGKKLGKISRKLHKYLKSKNTTKKMFAYFLYRNFWIKSKRKSGVPIDQTLGGDVMAQIQIVAKKLLK